MVAAVPLPKFLATRIPDRPGFPSTPMYHVDLPAGLEQMASGVKKIDERIRDHVIICGFGRFSQAVLKHLGTTAPPAVFVELNPDLEPRLRAMGHPYVLGSAIDPIVLEAAGVRRARVLVAGTGNEAANISIVMAARELNPGLEIHARAESADGARWLRGASATEVVDPYRLAARVIVRDLAGGPKVS